MANIKSAKKRIRQTAKQEARNAKVTEGLKREMKAISRMKPTEAKKEQPKAESIIGKAVKKGVIHKNKAARMQRKTKKLAL